jgi:hypothetical protein
MVFAFPFQKTYMLRDVCGVGEVGDVTRLIKFQVLSISSYEIVRQLMHSLVET